MERSGRYVALLTVVPAFIGIDEGSVLIESESVREIQPAFAQGGLTLGFVPFQTHLLS